jgi:hypothetical protein
MGVAGHGKQRLRREQSAYLGYHVVQSGHDLGRVMNYIKERSKNRGTLLFMPYDSDKVEEWNTITCCHCNHSFIIKPGSGKERGWCVMCNASTCGEPGCDLRMNGKGEIIGCVPFEKRLEIYERRFELRKNMERTFGL